MNQLGLDSPVTLLFVSESAVIDLSMERFSVAESHAVDALNGFTQCLGSNNSHTLDALNLLAIVYYKTGWPKKEIETLQDLLQEAKSLWGT